MFTEQSLKKILVSLSFLIVVIFGSYYFIYTDIKSRNENTSTLSQEISLQSSKKDYLKSTQKMIESIQTDIDGINNSIVGKEDDIAFIESLEAIARSNGLTIDIDSLLFEEDPKLSPAGLTNFIVKAKITGSWSGTYLFLSQLESLPIRAKITRYDFVTSVGPETVETKTTSKVWRSAFEITVLKYK